MSSEARESKRRNNVVDRRRFLKTALAGTAASALTPSLWGCQSLKSATAPRIVIVGGGMAGLNAAYTLQKSGLNASIFEASGRTGGRMYSALDLFHPGQCTEIGGEFIDSIHADVLSLVEEFGLDLIDTDNEVLSSAFFFGGQHYTEAEIIEAFREVAPRIAADYASTGDVVNFRDDGGASALDQMTLSEYFDRIGADGVLRELLEVAYVTEYGLDAHDQSALNFLFLVGTDLSSGFEIFGVSDERFKVVGGNQRVVDELAVRLEDQIELDHRLASIRPDGAGYSLSFDVDAGTREVRADIVILTLPFSTLRQVDLRALALPRFKTRAIEELGYGMNAKLFAATDSRPWRRQGFAGDTFSDEAYQLMWDNAQLQPGDGASLTFYSGGAAGLQVGEGSPEEQVERMLPGAERTFPGTRTAYVGRARRFHWPTHPFTLGSYACYRPGQWTSIAGAEIEPVDRLFFAGEHCSYEFQGFMNGAAETGRQAAQAIVAEYGALAVA